MALETIAFAGWPNCLRLANEHAELIITTDVGPRVLSYRAGCGDNVFWIDEAHAGGSAEADFQVRGGHRFWVSPEDARSYAPDNTPVEIVAQEASRVTLRNPAAAPWFLTKTLTISLAPDSTKVTLHHELTNEGPAPVTVATWALTVLAPGGFEIIPQPPLRDHGVGGFLAERVVVPWSYMDFSDPRWRFGTRYWLLVPDATREATKLGFTHPPGWLGWVGKEAFFVKQFALEEGAVYPDFGCNCETFTKAEFLELESLGPLRTLAPGESTAHTETWHLFAGVSAPGGLDDASLQSWLAPMLAAIGSA